MSFLNGLDLIAITDHQSCANVRSAIAAADILRLEQKTAPVIIAGMEIECSEGFHVLAYFPDPDTADSFEIYLKGHRFLTSNRPEIFGQQYLYDEKDHITGTIPDLLLTAVDLSSSQIEESVWSAGGYMVPAHIDRHSYSMLESLGCIPVEFGGKILELSKNCDQAMFFSMHPELLSYYFLRNSDAHRLCDISDPGYLIDLLQITPDTFDATHIIQALREKSFK